VTFSSFGAGCRPLTFVSSSEVKTVPVGVVTELVEGDA
jgi:hypothetical protein